MIFRNSVKQYTAILLAVAVMVVSPIAQVFAVDAETQLHVSDSAGSLQSDAQTASDHLEEASSSNTPGTAEGEPSENSETSSAQTDPDSGANVSSAADETAPESDLEAAAPSGQKYDVQPATPGEVQAAVQAYNAQYQTVSEAKGAKAALLVTKPHWEFRVAQEWMPEGYQCIEVAGDTEFTLTYFTFAKEVTYDPQPQIIEDVLSEIFTYICDDGKKIPHWEFAVSEELLPSNYQCVLVENDEVFGMPYYTFELLAVQNRSISIGGFTLEGEGTGASPYIIDSGAKLYALATSVNSGSNYAGKYFALGSNVIISVYTNWPAIGARKSAAPNNVPFKGTFDGRGYTVLGLKGTDQDGYGEYGLFGRTDGATIKNVNLVLGGDVSAANDTGALVGHAVEGTVIENSRVDGNGYTVRVTGGGRSGGFIGWTNGETLTEASVKISNCSVTNISTYTSGNYSAGFIGVGRNAVITNCSVKNKSGNVNESNSYSGGFAGALHDYTETTGCSVTDPQSQVRSHYVGGFAGVIYADGRTTAAAARVTNCYTAGGKAISLTGYYAAGGFAADIYDTAIVKNCYSQTDVLNKKNISDANCSAGGFAGYIRMSAQVINCYATGSVTVTAYGTLSYTGIGGFTGNQWESSKISNCYSTGTINVQRVNSASVGGFIGVYSAGSVTNCFVDTTTARYMMPVGGKSTFSGITALSTKQMIQRSTFSGWNAKENFLGAALGAGTESAPWYIDDEITYPYLYYQYDGNSKADTCYFLANTVYSDGSALGKKRADFVLAKNLLPLKVKSAGAAYAYLPYSGSSRYEINRNSFTDTPGLSYSTTEKNSLGSVSATNIIAFDGSPVIEKSNNTAQWNVSDSSSYTYVGDRVTYTVHLANYSDVNDWRNVVLTDPLGKGVTLVDGTLKLTNYAGTEVNLTFWDVKSGAAEPVASKKPYYTYLYQNSVTPSDGRSPGVYVLTIYFPDFSALAVNGYITEYTLTFDGLINREAASSFSNTTTYNGHIRNDVKAVGDFVNHSDDTMVVSALTVEGSDTDEDPVYNKWMVSYNNGLSGNQEIETVKGYYLTDGTGTHTVLKNTTENGLGFQKPGYRFTGWLAKNAQGTVVNTYAWNAGTGVFLPTGFSVTQDIVMYAQWQMEAKFEFYKVDGADHTVTIAGVKFRLFEYTGSAAVDIDDSGTYPPLINIGSPGTAWRQVGAEIASGADGKVSFEIGETTVGTFYQLVETETNPNYELPAGQWLLYVDAIDGAGNVTFIIKAVSDANSGLPPAFIEIQSGTLQGARALINLQKIVMPATGGKGTAFHVLTGALLVLGGTLFAIERASARKRSKGRKVC